MNTGSIRELRLPPPNEKQKVFFQADTKYVAYGGARGGGKSWAARVKAILMALQYPGIRLLIIRRSFPELRENHVLPLQEMLMGIARYVDAQKAFIFPTGSRIKLGYCDKESDVLQYQGQEFDAIFIDEATQFSEYQYKMLTATLRGANNFPKRMYLTCNPGGVGHAWVKRLFVDREYRPTEQEDEYTFIQALAYDNHVLMQTDPGYIQMLENLPDGIREAWLDGNWDVYDGQYFTSFDRTIHVIEPFEIPPHWYRYTSLDYGLDMLAGYVYAVDEEGFQYVTKEVYKSGLIISAAATEMKELIGDDEIEVNYAPPDLWNRRQDTGRSAAEIFADNGLPLIKSSNDRVQGWLEVAEALEKRTNSFGDISPKLKIFSNCSNLIRCIPLLIRNPKNPSDCSTEPHEITHAPDALRYFIAGRPFQSEQPLNPDDEYYSDDDQIQEFLEYGRAI